MKGVFLKTKNSLILWIFIHAVIIICFLFLPKAKIDADFISIVPTVTTNAEFEEPLRDFFSNSANTLMLFVESNTFEQAKNTAVHIESFAKKKSSDITVHLTKSNDELMQFIAVLDKYKYHVLSEAVRNELSVGNAPIVAEDAVATVFSPFFIPAFADIITDPFLLVNSRAEELLDMLSSSNVMLEQKDEVLYTNVDGKHNVYMTIELPAKFTDSTTSESFLNTFLPYIDSLQTDDSSVYMSGVLVHSYYSQKVAEKEIILISVISFCIILLVFFLTFRSLYPFLICICTIIISICFAYAATSIFFPSIHIFSFVFGTSLIGITIDYSIHYIADWFFEKNVRVLDKILSSLFLGLATTVISYIAISFSGMILLRQLAFFSIAGMISSFLSVLLLYPIFFSKRENRSNVKMIKGYQSILTAYIAFFRKKKQFVFLIIITVICFAIYGIKNIHYDFSAASMYAVPDNLLQDEIAVSERLSNPESADLIFIKGNTAEDILVLQERLQQHLPNAFSLSMLIPSVQRQKENLALVEANILPLLDTQLTAFGINNNNTKKNILENFNNTKDEYLLPETLYSFTMFSELQKLFFKSGDMFFSVIPTQKKLSAEEKEEIQSVNENIQIFSMQSEIDDALHATVFSAIRYTILAYGVIFILILLTIHKKQALVIIFLELVTVCIVLAMHGAFSLPINMFSILALILALGISSDYFIFFSKSGALPVTILVGVTLAMFTTLLSFGTLAFSSFIPVKSFALSLFFGVFIGFLLAPLLLLLKKDDKD